MKVMNEKSEILKVFRGAQVLVTGGTGFMGQMLVEKLLRTCQIDKLYLIVRPKKGLTEKERIDKIFGGLLYERLKQEQPRSLSKVVLVCGNCEQRGLGLSEEDRATLVREVNIVFHSAATVRFDAKLWTAVAINILGTKEMLDLAKKMPQLKAFVHISTAYSYCPLQEVDEKFYTTPMCWKELVQLVDMMDHDTLDTMTPIILGEWPNTYSFTKALCEAMIQDEAEGLPLGILRPGIVVSSAHEPITCWVNNVYGAVGILAAAAEGLLRSAHCDKDLLANIVPVDMAINAGLAIAWDVAQETKGIKRTENEDAIPIFNYVSTERNGITWNSFTELNKAAIDYPSSFCIWYHCFTYNKYRFVHNIYIIFLHLLPAILMDLGARLVRKKPIMWSAYQRLHKFTDVISYFTTKKWVFHDNNTQNLWKKMNRRDKTLFHFDIADVDWEILIFGMIKGMRLYIIGEGFDKLKQTRARYKKLKYLHYTVVYTFRALVAYVGYRMVSCYKDVLLDALQ